MDKTTHIGESGNPWEYLTRHPQFDGSARHWEVLDVNQDIVGEIEYCDEHGWSGVYVGGTPNRELLAGDDFMGDSYQGVLNEINRRWANETNPTL